MDYICCICRRNVALGEPDSYTLRVSQPAALSVQEDPELLWAHGTCLRSAMPVMSIEIPKATGGQMAETNPKEPKSIQDQRTS